MLARITSIGGDLYHVHILEGGEGHPDQGLPGQGGRPPHVGNRPPGSGRPPHVGGGPAHPGWGGNRPVDPDYGFGSEHPDQGLPGGGSGNFPGHLPSEPPPQIMPGQTLIMVRDQHGTWYYASIPNSSAPPRPQPQPPGGGEHPDQGLPGQGGRPPHIGGGPAPQPPVHPGNRPPGSGPGVPPRPDQGLPPTPQPR
jgi:hypothetical protein